MLKTLRITSLIALIAAVCGVGAIGVVGLRGDSEIQAFLDKPGVVDNAKGEKADKVDPKEVESPLVVQSRLFALRIDPPPPPKPQRSETKPVEQRPEPTENWQTGSTQAQAARGIPRPAEDAGQRQVYPAGNGTVRSPEPTRSMALLQQTGGNQEWFRQGERVGHLDIRRSAKTGAWSFSQGGRNAQELFVPESSRKGKSILKNERKSVSRHR